MIKSFLAFFKLNSADNRTSLLLNDEFLYEKLISFLGTFFSSFFELISSTLIKFSEISPPQAPAFIIKAPPNVPGTPFRFSKPIKLFLTANLTIFPSMAPHSAYKIFSFNRTSFNDFFKEITAPLIPLSLTRIFEPEPNIVTLVLFSLIISITLIKSSLLLGKIIKSAGPPIP